MKFNLKTLNSVLQVTKIANVHFLEFETSMQTVADKHPFCELLFSYSGTVNVNAENFNGKLKKGELIIHKANETHSLSTHKNKKTTIVILGFECDNPHLDYFSKNKISLNDSEIKQIARIVKEGRNVFAPPYDKPVYDMKKKDNQIFGSEQLLRSLLENFLIELTRKYLFSKNEEDGYWGFKFEEIIDYVNLHYNEKITLDEIAFLFNTNRSAFCNQFKMHTGYTFINYIANRKIEKTKELFLTSNLSISQIAQALNFDDVAYFCRFFKKQTGLTPKEYKKQLFKNK
ncbi:MAG: helix-turn-helix transcriptional regulator [Clostridia bacterium]|nr:helix-turn-helix transcriptional regulator [Clostridia bacterium]